MYTLLTPYKYNKPLETVVMTASAVLGGQSGVSLDSKVWWKGEYRAQVII